MPNIQYHLLEIRVRFFYLLLSGFFTFFICYNNQLEFIYIIGKPFIQLQQTFIFLELTEAFYTLIKISTLITLFLMIPFFFYHFWSFFIPSFYVFERNKINFYFFFLFCLFIAEILFIYFFLLPKICHFLISFEMTSKIENSNLQLQPLISVEFTARIESYVRIVVKFLSTILAIFQLPLCVCFLYSKSFLHVSSLSCNRKYLIVGSLLISAFIVPPDLMSQFAVTLFFYILLEFLIFVGFFFE
jgi:sec-independent protein translocase protein TatC